MQTGENLQHLLSGLTKEREILSETHGKRVPFAVKIAPDLEDGEIKEIANTLVEYGINGVIATNTTVTRLGVEGLAHSEEEGGLSGCPLLTPSTEVVAKLSEALQGAIPIIACGGIFSADEVRLKFEAGASLVQVYSGFIYQGPGIVADIIREL
jgi:dihydroorotate dehydrogenase